MTRPEIIAALVAILAIVAAIAFCTDAHDKRVRLRKALAGAIKAGNTAADLAEHWQGEWQIERKRYLSLAKAHQNCDTHVRAHLRVTRKSDDAWFDELYGDSHPAHEKKAEDR